MGGRFGQPLWHPVHELSKESCFSCAGVAYQHQFEYFCIAHLYLYNKMKMSLCPVNESVVGADLGPLLLAYPQRAAIGTVLTEPVIVFLYNKLVIHLL